MGSRRLVENLRFAIIAVFVFVGLFLQPAPAQNGVSDELVEAASNGPVGMLHRDPSGGLPVVCSEGQWSQMLGCCAASSGVCVGEGLDSEDRE